MSDYLFEATLLLLEDGGYIEQITEAPPQLSNRL